MELVVAIWISALPFVFMIGVLRIVSSMVIRTFMGGRSLD